MVFRTARKSWRFVSVFVVACTFKAHLVAAPFEFGVIITDGGLELAPVYKNDSAISGPLLSLAPAFADGPLLVGSH